MASCLDNIVSVNGFCGEEETPSLSGLDIFEGSEVSLQRLASIAPAEVVSGLQLARNKVALAVKLMKNDLMSVMAASNVIPDLTAISYNTGTFKSDKTYASDSKTRGVTLHKSLKSFGGNGISLKKQVIEYVRIMPLADHADVPLYILDNYAGGVLSTFNIDLVAGEVNEFNLNYAVKGTHADVYLNNIGVYSNFLTCFVGCNGSMPNECGYTKGYYNGKAISAKEGYGIQLSFKCHCDYDELLCGLANTFIGELVWLKSRELLLQETLYTDRLNDWTIYGREETQALLTRLNNEYVTKWQVFVNSLPNILRNFGDSCLNCRGIKWVTNT